MSIVNDKKRLVLEHYAMRQRWGDSPRWCCNRERTLYWWEHDLKVEGNSFPIRVVYPDDFPASPPELILRSALPAGTPHIWPTARTCVQGTRLCWFRPDSTPRARNSWNPATDTAAMAIGVAYRWCLAYLVWRATGAWPVPDAVENQ